MKELDKDKSGQIELGEFLTMMEGFMRTVNDESEIVKAFKLFDQDKDGFLSARDLRLVMRTLGVEMSLFEAEAMVFEGDKDGDGKINYNDFYAMMVEKA